MSHPQDEVPAGPLKVGQERSPSGSTDTPAGSEDQLNYAEPEHDLKSSARREQLIEQKDDISLIDLQVQLPERELTQADKARIKQLLNGLHLSRKEVTRIESNMVEALAAKNSEIEALKKRVAQLENVLSLMEVENSLPTRELQFIRTPAHCVQGTSTEERNNTVQEEVSLQIYQNKVAGCSHLLCDLPDEVLLQILSFLPMTDAVRTSVLSKRWGHLWALVPDLHFSNSDLSKMPLFLKLVGRACALRSGSAVRAFSLNCKVVGGLYNIKKLITSVVTCGVRDLSLLLDSSRKGFVLPSSIFACATLERLRVQSPCILKLPLICLSKLKVLILSEVIFKDTHSLEKLFSSPSLEKLEIIDCDWRNVNNIHISAPKLDHLYIKVIWTNSHGRILYIDGACPKSFHYEGWFQEECLILGDATQLIEARIVFYFGGSGELCYKLLSICSTVKELTLSGAVLREIAKRDELPLFSNMIKLKVDRIYSSNVKGLWAILRRCPHLRSLYFREAFNYDPANGRDELLCPVPSCFSTDLEEISVNVCSYPFHQEQLFLVAFFLEKAMALKQMTIRLSNKYVDKEKFLLDVSRFPLGSKNCRILLRPQP